MTRALDIVLAGVGLIATAPLLLASVVLIRTTTKGPGLFRQERVGMNRQPFICLKLRTMRDDTPCGGEPSDRRAHGDHPDRSVAP